MSFFLHCPLALFIYQLMGQVYGDMGSQLKGVITTDERIDVW